MPSDRQLEVLFTRVVLFGPLAIALALAAMATVRGELGLIAFAALAGVAIALWMLVSALERGGRPVTWLMSLGVLALLLLVPEMGLRAAGFRHEAGIELQLTEKTGFDKLIRDPERFWKYDPVRPEVNSWGFRGTEIEVPKPEGVFRVLYLGDSCADLGDPPYPRIVERLLNRTGGASGGREVETVSLAIAGYTSHQGLVVARQFASLVEPDAVVLHYGWNDHWLAYGAPDAEISPPSRLAGVADVAYSSSRILQWVHSRRASAPSASGAEESSRPADLRNILGSELQASTRVPPDRYRENLLEIARLFDEMGVPVVFVTPPAAHRTLGTPIHFVEFNYATDADAVIDLHDEYVEIVREVARDSDQYLYDLAAEIDGLDAPKLEEIFLFDGIHYEAYGHLWVARRVARFLREQLGV